MTAGQPADPAPAGRRAAGTGPLPDTVVTQSMLWKLVDACPDGLALTDGAGTLVLVNRRMQEMFGYDRAELVGSPVERLMPAGLRAAHRDHRAGYARLPTERPMGAGLRLLGLRKDQTTFPAEISLSPLPAEVGQFTVAVIRDVTRTRQPGDQATAPARGYAARELPDTVISRLFHAGLILQAAAGLPANAARQRILDAAGHLDDTIREIRTAMFARTSPGCRPWPQKPRDHYPQC